jgi:hypothetical protein
LRPRLTELQILILVKTVYDISADVWGILKVIMPLLQSFRRNTSYSWSRLFAIHNLVVLVNFKIKIADKKPFRIYIRNTIGSYGLIDNLHHVSGTNKNSVTIAYNYKQGNGFRPTPTLKAKIIANLNYQLNDKHLCILIILINSAQQAGGLTDVMFNQKPTQSNRARNWFAVEFICA